TWEEVKGDVFVALGDNVNARQSYQMAVEHLGDGRSRPLLELKLADVPVTSEMLQPEEDA
nr:tetratricopeptide repeat protein [Pseudomonadales bacterium]